jgi:hypothetical protein
MKGKRKKKHHHSIPVCLCVFLFGFPLRFTIATTAQNYSWTFLPAFQHCFASPPPLSFYGFSNPAVVGFFTISSSSSNGGEE